MGNCCDRFEEHSIYDDSDQERRPLLHDEGVARSEARSVSPGAAKDSYGDSSAHGAREKRSDEQTALNRILQNTADQVIDVGTIDSRGLEQRDYMDRARQYSARLALSVKPPPFLQPANPIGRMSCTNSPSTCLAAPPPPDHVVAFVLGLSQNCSESIRDIVVTHQEELVVPFGI